MHEQVLQFLQRMREARPEVFTAGRVLECGAYDINGSARPLFHAAGEYIGLDWRAGPGVDVVGLTHTYVDPGGFDVIVSTEMLEHDPHWQHSLRAMVRLLKPGGSLLLTCAAPDRPAHEVECSPRPAYYRGLSITEALRVLRRHGHWEHVHAEQRRAPADSYIACFNLQDKHLVSDEVMVEPDFTMSVVIPTVGQPTLTAAAVRSARECADAQIEVVLVDNGSHPDSAAALARVDSDVYLRYDHMLGYPAACNRGVEAASGEFVTLMNNDATFASGHWDTRLQRALVDWPADMVAPTTDFVANTPQLANGPNDRAPFAVKRLFFVCVAMRRRVYLGLGGLDERFGLGNSEDEELCHRILHSRDRYPFLEMHGALLVEPRVFVHHQGHATFGRLPKGMFDALLVNNRRLLAEIVGHTATHQKERGQ